MLSKGLIIAFIICVVVCFEVCTGKNEWDDIVCPEGQKPACRDETYTEVVCKSEQTLAKTNSLEYKLSKLKTLIMQFLLNVNCVYCRFL